MKVSFMKSDTMFISVKTGTTGNMPCPNRLVGTKEYNTLQWKWASDSETEWEHQPWFVY